MIRRAAAAVALAAALAAAPAAGCGAGAPTAGETAAYVRIGAATLAQLSALVVELLEALESAKSNPPACTPAE